MNQKKYRTKTPAPSVSGPTAQIKLNETIQLILGIPVKFSRALTLSIPVPVFRQPEDRK